MYTFHRARLLLIGAAASLLICLSFQPPLPMASAHAAPAIHSADPVQTTAHTAITRDMILARAQVWVNDRVPYNQRGWYQGYREDCSGFVSMAWELTKSYTTYTLNQVAQPISKDELQPGDVLNNKNGGDNPDFAHVLLFVSWANSAHSAYNAYEENPYWGGAHFTQNIPFPFWPGYHNSASDYSPLRFNGLTSAQPVPTATPTLSQLTLYVSAIDNSLQLSLQALDANTGKQLWRFYQNTPDGPPTGIAPVAYAAGIVYVTVSVPDFSFLYALNGSTGSVLWTSPAGIGYISSVAAVANGMVYLVTGMGNAQLATSSIIVLDAVTGQLRWQYAKNNVTGFVLDGGIAFIADDNSSRSDPQLHAINAISGSVLWTKPIPGDPDDTFGTGMGMAAAGGLVYMGTCLAQPGFLCYALALAENTGTLIWQYDTHGTDIGVEAAGGQVYVSTVGSDQSAQYVVVDAYQGTPMWKSSCPFAQVFLTTQRAYATCSLYGNDSVAAYDSATGRVLWQSTIGANGDSLFVTGVTDGTLYLDESNVLQAPEAVTTYALDTNSGNILWKKNEAEVLTVPGYAITVLAIQETGPISTLDVVDSHTGTPLWSFSGAYEGRVVASV